MKYPDSCGLGVTFPRKQTFQISKTICWSYHYQKLQHFSLVKIKPTEASKVWYFA